MEKFKNSTKYNQQDLRRLMHDHKNKSQKQKDSQTKISSPLAKYDNLGRLHCIICRTIIRTESVWKVHINTKVHKLNVESAKKQKDVFLLNPSCNTHVNENPATIKQSPKVCAEVPVLNVLLNQPTATVAPITPDEPIPEGFFDDPVKDAKARNTEYKDPKDEEWERFKREIKEQSYYSNAIIAGEQDEANVDRQLEEIDEQMQKWSKVIQLEKNKEIVNKQKQNRKDVKKSVEVLSSDESDSFDEFSDWRSKRVC